MSERNTRNTENQTAKRRPGRPRIQRGDPLRRTTVMLPESLLAQIDSNLGEIDGEQSRNRWLIEAATAYLNRREDSVLQEDWHELHAYVQAQHEQASRNHAALERDVQRVDDELTAFDHLLAAMTPEQRRYLELVTQWKELEGKAGRWSVVSGELSAVLARMDTAEQWSDAAAHPVAHQDE